MSQSLQSLSIESKPEHESLLSLADVLISAKPDSSAAVLQRPPVTEGGEPGPGQTGGLVDGPQVVCGHLLRLTSTEEEYPGDGRRDVSGEGWEEHVTDYRSSDIHLAGSGAPLPQERPAQNSWCRWLPCSA